ncbi:Hypothetical predicted protein [Xyrichtys novacula]|uniref:Uncharacterized protein n=1 Tax=Xyrichtys novacula TaxID=13765 RepID=A0AAV1FT53_XYRNO|nr:Hypothetical predicted protein [Xyrichtys novacula]
MSLKILSITVLLFMGSLVSSAASLEKRWRGLVIEVCCYFAKPYTDQPIVECIKQKPTGDCYSDNFAVKEESGNWQCIKSDSLWMKQQIQQGKVSCSEEPVY